MMLKTLPCALLATLLAFAVPPTEDKKDDGVPTPEAAAKRATLPAGMTAAVWAAEPLMMNPVAFCFDEQGRCFIAETTRFGHGVPDTRSHMGWLDEDIACRTVADRLAMYEKHKYKGYEKFDDLVRCVWDGSGKGVADQSAIFSQGYNQPADGLGSGVLARKGSVYYTNIPALYKLRDTARNGVADVKETLATGFGVRVQFLGHDLHGLRVGPDGRLYFTVGDRGLNVINKEGVALECIDSGAVLRCELDGSTLEIVHTGLRNPQELAFNDAGDLFTYDNNCDSGDKARWVHILPGGDSGWRCGYQYGSMFHTPAVKEGNRGPWNSEGIWKLAADGPPAYVLPPLAHFGNGPAGITHYPGVGLSDKYQDHFFACDFTSNAGSSKIWSLACKPKGASFEVVDLQPFVQTMVPTDCEFGPDGAFYWSDWTGGWSPPNKGRIFRAVDAEAMKNPAVREAQGLIAGGLSTKSVDELIAFLNHAHFTVRQEAHFELAARKFDDVLPKLQALLQSKAELKAKRHAVWALGMLYRANAKDTKKGDPTALADLLTHADAELRRQAVRALGEAYNGFGYHHEAVQKLLRDPDPAVQVQAAFALASIFRKMAPPREALAELMGFADRAAADPTLRHAAVMLLAAYDPMLTGDLNMMAPKLTAAQKLVMVLALRRIQSGQADLPLIPFLRDTDAAVAIEAARAIYDTHKTAAMLALSLRLEEASLPEPVAFRAIAASFVIGNSKGLANFAARTTAPAAQRVAALKLLADWAKPPRRDPITGLALDLKERRAKDAADALKPHLDKIFTGTDAVRSAAVAAVSALGLKEVGPVMVKLVKDASATATTRVDALYALQALKAKELAEALTLATTATDARLRAAAKIIAAKANDQTGDLQLTQLILDDAADVTERKMALDALAGMKESGAIDRALVTLLEKSIKGEVPTAMKLEVIEAAEARTTAKKLKLHEDVKTKLSEHVAAIRKTAGQNLLKRYTDCLEGGDAAKGREVFLSNAAAACQRCHKLEGQGGDVGPAMETLKKEHTREYLLEAVVVPNAHIAEGYQSVIVQTAEGRTVTGVLRRKEKDKYVIITPENKTVEVLREDIESEKPDRSAMPEDVYKKLTRRELRDVVEFLAGLRK